MELMNIYTVALARIIRLPTTKEGWLAVLGCAVVYVISYLIISILVKGTSLDDSKKQAICKYAPWVITFIVMFIAMF